jgi:hypothetical protein
LALHYTCRTAELGVDIATLFGDPTLGVESCEDNDPVGLVLNDKRTIAYAWASSIVFQHGTEEVRFLGKPWLPDAAAFTQTHLIG